MAAFGYKQWNLLGSLDREHSLLVARSYGKLHALSFALRRLKPAVYHKLEENTPDHIHRVLRLTEDRKVGLKAQMNLALSCLDKEEDRIAYKALEEYFGRVLETIQAAEAGAGDHSVLAHCESWINNYLIDYQARLATTAQ
ncbi:hypothetical protein PPYR_03590 [Photinus pyralis]|uniref:Uncharacterized protein n=1 Tax=Photinus pyralis TaxID=7054 RepID=A0A5N4A386_PHOPY|nr:hypothetical protein PPYR_03590 [Photinus pyralis]